MTRLLAALVALVCGVTAYYLVGQLPEYSAAASGVAVAVGVYLVLKGVRS